MLNLMEILKKIKLPFFTNFEIYFDLGTSITKIAIKDKGVILREPSFLGYNSRIKDYSFTGTEAKTILGKTPDFIRVIRPIVNGVISDFDAEVFLLRKFLERSVYLYTENKMLKPMMIGIASVPTIATEIEQKAVKEALLKIGMSQIFLVERPLATASGAGLNIFSHEPALVADLGGGLIELSIVGSSGILSQKTFKNAGDQMNKVIFNYVHLKYGLILGEATCEQLKIDLLNFNGVEKTVVIRGKSLENGLPKSVKIKSSDINEALLTNFNLIVDGIKELIETSASEVVDEVMKKGIVLTGGLSRIPGIDKFFERELKMTVYCSDKHEYTTINGLIKLTANEEDFSKIIIQ
ncbi:MAG: rod shape-determining protein [Patescibacteria group bacterium]